MPDAAEDLASTVWIDVAANLSSFRGDEDGFRGWLVTIAHRRLVDEHRRRERRPEHSVCEPDRAELLERYPRGCDFARCRAHTDPVSAGQGNGAGNGQGNGNPATIYKGKGS